MGGRQFEKPGVRWNIEAGKFPIYTRDVRRKLYTLARDSSDKQIAMRILRED